jgi:prephenate dehydrogenase
MDDNNFVGVFGYGRFGKFLCDELRRVTAGRIPVRVYDPIATRDAGSAPTFAQTWSAAGTREKMKSDIEFVSAAEAARGAIIIFAVPVSELKTALLAAAPFMSAGAIVMDTCSVKAKAVELMNLFLPAHVEILGTHPLFGPDNAIENQGLQGLKVVFCPVRITPEHTARIRQLVEGAGLHVIETTPELHDRAMAQTQSLFHLVARAVKELPLSSEAPAEIVTPGPARLFEDLKILQNDTPQLFLDIQELNPYAKEVRKKFIQKLLDLDRMLDENETP